MASASIPADRDAQAAEEAMRYLRSGHIEQAAICLHTRLGSRVIAYLRRHRIPEADAEELESDVWIKFLQNPCDQRMRPVVWLWTIVQSVLVDWARERGALKRGGTGDARLEVELNEEALELLMEGMESTQAPAWLKLCIERAAHQLEQDDPSRAHVLWLWYRGHSAAEIAVIYGATPPPNEKQETAARNRVLVATRKARDYFQHCRD